MKLEEAINLLKTHQEWRLGADTEMIYPRVKLELEKL